MAGAQPRKLQEKGIVLDCLGFKELLIATHGGYTPARNIIQRGSGNTKVPTSVVQISFYSDHNVASAGNAVAQLAIDVVKQEGDRQAAYNNAGVPAPVDPNYQGAVIPTPVETKFTGQEIPNYSLTHNGKYETVDRCLDLLQMDVLRIKPGEMKAHLSDVWAVLAKHGLRYNIVHYGACRVNKLDPRKEVIT